MEDVLLAVQKAVAILGMDKGLNVQEAGRKFGVRPSQKAYAE